MSDFSSESDSESDHNNNNNNIEENNQDVEISDVLNIVKHKGYYCNKCGYRTNRLKHFIRHITRKVPCYVVKDYDYGLAKANELYKKRSTCVLDLLDKLENNEQVDLKKLNKYVSEIEVLGRVYPNFKQEDVDEIRSIISIYTKNE